jgi:hypothetical protein
MYTLLYIYHICDMFRLVLKHFHGDRYIQSVPGRMCQASGECSLSENTLI